LDELTQHPLNNLSGSTIGVKLGCHNTSDGEASFS
jgi:hypothetical protein